MVQNIVPLVSKLRQMNPIHILTTFPSPNRVLPYGISYRSSVHISKPYHACYISLQSKCVLFHNFSYIW
jgi:hypothetical protein